MKFENTKFANVDKLIYKRQASLNISIPEEVDIIVPCDTATYETSFTARYSKELGWKSRSGSKINDFIHGFDSLSTSDTGKLARVLSNISIFHMVLHTVNELATAGVQKFNIFIKPMDDEIINSARIGGCQIDEISSLKAIDIFNRRQVYPVIKCDLENPEVFVNFVQQMSSELSNVKKRREVTFNYKHPSENVTGNNIQILVGEGNSAARLAKVMESTPVNANTYLYWTDAVQLFAPAVTHFNEGEDIAVAIENAIAINMSTGNNLLNFSHIKDTVSGSKASKIKEITDVHPLLNIVFTMEPIQPHEFALKYTTVGNKSALSNPDKTLRSHLLDVLSTNMIALNMMAISSLIDGVCRNTIPQGASAFSGLIQQNMIADAVDQMYENMETAKLPSKLTTTMLSMSQVTSDVNILGAGGIGSIFAEMFKNFSMPSFISVFNIVINERAKKHIGFTDMDNLEIHNLNRSSLFTIKNAVCNHTKVETIKNYLSTDSVLSAISPIAKVSGNDLSAPFYGTTRDEFQELYATRNNNIKNLAQRGVVIDCRDIVNAAATMEKTAIKLSYNGGNRLGFHFNLDRFVHSLITSAGSNYEITPSFAVPPKMSVAIGIIFVNLPFFKEYAEEYAEFNIENLIANSLVSYNA